MNKSKPQTTIEEITEVKNGKAKIDLLKEDARQSFLEILQEEWGTAIEQRKQNPNIEQKDPTAFEIFKNIYEPTQNLINHLLEIGVYALMDKDKKVDYQSLLDNEKDAFTDLHAKILSPDSEWNRHAQKYHEFSPIEHALTIGANRIKYKEDLYKCLQQHGAAINPQNFEEKVLGGEIVAIMDTIGFVLHDIAKEMPYYSREDCGLKTTHRGHELMGAYLVNPEVYKEQIKKDKIYSKAYTAQDWLILERAARTINKTISHMGYTKEEIDQLGCIIELHFEIAGIRNKLFHSKLYNHEDYNNNPEKVKNIIHDEVTLLIDKYQSKPERYHHILTLEQYLHLIGITYLWDNESKIQFMPDLAHGLDKNFIIAKKHEIGKKAQSLLEAGASKQELNELIHQPFGHFAFEGFLEATREGQESYEILNQLIEENQTETGINQKKVFAMKNSYKKFLHQEHLKAYVDSINSMYLTLWIYEDYLQECCIFEEKR